MITEDYVSYGTAKLLKEKGFDAKCIGCYYKGELNVFDLPANYNMGNSGNTLSAPTLQMAMKWLREKHGLHCYSDYDFVLGWYCEITSLKETVEYDYEEMKHYHPEKDNGFSSPEKACEAGIKHCLENLI